MKRFGCIFGLAAALGGCSTTSDIRGGEPALDRVSEQPIQKLTGCIGDKLEASPLAGATRFSTRPTGAGGFSILGESQFYGGTNTDIIVDLVPEAGKTRVQMYTNLAMGSEKMRRLVSLCF